MCLEALLILTLAQAQPHATGTRITPPTVATVAPLGAARGTTMELTIEGFNLAKASGIYFSEKGITGKILRVKELPDLPDIRIGAGGLPASIDLGPLPPRNQVTVELDIDPDTPIGPVNFRLLTPLGTSPAGMIQIEPYYGEAPDREPNDALDNSFETFLPAILAGTIAKPGDLDHYKINVKANDELVFENGGLALGSALMPVVAILDAEGNVVKEYTQNAFAHKFAKAGTHYLRIADYLNTGGGRHFYRLKVGNFPVVSSAYPLGLQQGKTANIQVTGHGLAAKTVAVKGERSAEDDEAAIIRPDTGKPGLAFNTVRLAVGIDPEVESTGRNLSTTTAQAITAPVTINGWLEKDHWFKLAAKKDQRLILEVNARRLGSDLDSIVEVLDAQGKPVARALLRPVWETTTTLRDHDSVSRGIRLQAWNNLKVGDFVLLGSELIRIDSMPRGPDDDTIFEAFGGQRIAYLGTTSEAQANDRAVYKVQILAPGTKFMPNGMPVMTVNYRNDDGGPVFGKDSYLEFTAPADGEYFIRIADSSGQGIARNNREGKSGAYRLNVRPPRPDFRLAMNPRNPNVPRGGAIPVTLTAFRLDGFNDAIEVSLEGLPAGFTATKGVIGKGQVSTTVLISADANAQLAQATPIQPIGKAIGVTRVASPEDKLKLLALAPPADVNMTSQTKIVELEPGATAEVSVKITRQNGFGGRVPVQVMNLPPRVRVLDVGLNGVLLNETETERSFTIEALPNADPVEQIIYVGGQVETRSNQQNISAAPQPILLRVKPRTASGSGQ